MKHIINHMWRCLLILALVAALVSCARPPHQEMDAAEYMVKRARELQAMGVIMGDLLAANLDMHWVVYEDAKGRSRALRYRESNEYLFPITMISRRQEADNDTPVAVIYQKAYDIIAPLRPELPFR